MEFSVMFYLAINLVSDMFLVEFQKTLVNS